MEEKCYNLEELKERANKENPTHSFVWENHSRIFGRWQESATGKCLYCKSVIYVNIYNKEQIKTFLFCSQAVLMFIL